MLSVLGHCQQRSLPLCSLWRMWCPVGGVGIPSRGQSILPLVCRDFLGSYLGKEKSCQTWNLFNLRAVEMFFSSSFFKAVSFLCKINQSDVGIDWQNRSCCCVKCRRANQWPTNVWDQKQSLWCGEGSCWRTHQEAEIFTECPDVGGLMELRLLWALSLNVLWVNKIPAYLPALCLI